MRHDQSKVVAMAFPMVDEIEHELISQRTKESLAAKKKQGVKLGRPKGSGKSKLDPYKPEIEALLANGATQRFIAQRYGVSEVAVSRQVRKVGDEVMRPFSKGHLSDFLRERQKELLSKITALDTDYILRTSSTELEQYFAQQIIIEPLVLYVDRQYIENRQGVRIDVSGDISRGLLAGERGHVQGTELQVAIPFKGDPELWQFRPSRFSSSPYPDIEVLQDRVLMLAKFPDDTTNVQNVKQDIEFNTQLLSEAASSACQDVRVFNSQVVNHVKSAIERRRTLAAGTSELLVGLGIPIKRVDEPPTYALPVRRRKLVAAMPKTSTEPYQREPVLEEEDYEHILNVLSSMSLVIERSSVSFCTLSEEAIRDHFLIQLNGHYEGGATGETFNAAGRTDILVRAEDRNVFIGNRKKEECRGVLYQSQVS